MKSEGNGPKVVVGSKNLSLMVVGSSRIRSLGVMVESKRSEYGDILSESEASGLGGCR